MCTYISRWETSQKYMSVYVYIVYVHSCSAVVKFFIRGDFMAYTESSYKAAQKYREKHIKRVPLDMQVSLFEEIKAHAAARGESVNGFIKRAIADTMERDKENAGG